MYAGNKYKEQGRILLISTCYDRRPKSRVTNNLQNPQSNQLSTTGITKAVLCAMMSVQIVHIKETLLIIENSSQCNGGSRFPLSLSDGSFTISMTSYNRK